MVLSYFPVVEYTDDTVYGAKCADWQPSFDQPASFRVCGTPVPSATCQAACDGVGGYGQVTHSDGIMYDCYEAPAAATDGPFASSVEGGWGLLWVFPATLAELATDAATRRCWGRWASVLENPVHA